MVKQQVGGLITKCDFLCQDFFIYDFDKKADLIVIGEVLEHVEKPLEFLKRSKELLSDGGEILQLSLSMLLLLIIFIYFPILMKLKI